MRKLLLKNSLSGVLQSIVNMALVFTVIPIFVKMLGQENYGIFSLIIVVGNLNVFTNLGLTHALIKFLSEQGKVKESHYDILITFLLTFIILLPLSLTAAYLNKFVLISILNIPQANFEDVRLFYFYLLGSNFLLIIGQVAKAVLDSGQRIVTTNLIQIIYSFFYWGLILVVLLLGYQLTQIGIASFFAAIIWFITITYKAISYWGRFSLTGLSQNYRRIVKKQLT